MIRREELYKIGIINKPHGVRGELLFTFTDSIFDRVDCDYIICSIEGIFVPFFIKEYRFKSDTMAFITLDGIDDEQKARMFTNVEVFFPIKYVDVKEDQDLSYSYFVGFEAEDVRHGVLGMITKIDDSTANVLFIVESKEGKQYMIPAQPDLISGIDHENRRVLFTLPDGLLQMNHE